MLNTKSINKQKKIYDTDTKKEELTESSNGKDDIFLIKNENNIKKELVESLVILNDNNDDNNINKIDYIDKINDNDIIFNEIKNAFIINTDNSIFTILISDIINYIINLSTNENTIKKYIFIISFNNITNNNEFNFITNTIFTNNLNMMTKLQNVLYENINRDDFIKNDIIIKNKFLMFYYQLIIFMFKTTYDEKIFDKYKILNTYSTIAFRISSIILKQTFLLQNQYENVSKELENINNIKNNLHLKINKLSKQINIIQEISENTEDSNDNTNEQTSDNNINISNDIIKNSNKSTKSIENIENVENLIDSLTSSIIELENKNKQSDNTDSKNNTSKNITNNDSINKSNTSKNITSNDQNNKKISKNLLESLSFDSDNKYEEIEETSEPVNDYINDLIKISSMSDSTKKNSYNSKSVINNGKTYFNI